MNIMHSSLNLTELKNTVVAVSYFTAINYQNLWMSLSQFWSVSQFTYCHHYHCICISCLWWLCFVFWCWCSVCFCSCFMCQFCVIYITNIYALIVFQMYSHCQWLLLFEITVQHNSTGFMFVLKTPMVSEIENNIVFALHST